MSTDTPKKSDPRTVKLRYVRLSFPESLKDKKSTMKDGSGVPKHNCNFILETEARPGDPLSAKAAAMFDTNKELVRGAMEAAGVEFNGKAELYKRIMEDDPKRVCYRAGSRFKNEDGDIYKGYEGNFAISGSGPGGNKNPRRPKLYDRRKRPLKSNQGIKPEQIKDGFFFEEDQIPEIFYGGTYGDVILSFYGTDQGGLGIFCSIEAVRSLQEGDRVGGGTYVDGDDFDDEDDDGEDDFDGPADSDTDPLG
jgi:hypothetical protein